MLEILSRILKRPEVGPDWSLIEGCEFIADARGTLIVRPMAPHLHSQHFQTLVVCLGQADLRAFRIVQFDFSRVQELVGPWGVHFATLIKLAREVQSRVTVSGLSGQPAALAWLFRVSPEVRSLLSARPSTSDAGVVTGQRKVA